MKEGFTRYMKNHQVHWWIFIRLKILYRARSFIIKKLQTVDGGEGGRDEARQFSFFIQRARRVENIVVYNKTIRVFDQEQQVLSSKQTQRVVQRRALSEATDRRVLFVRNYSTTR